MNISIQELCEFLTPKLIGLKLGCKRKDCLICSAVLRDLQKWLDSKRDEEQKLYLMGNEDWSGKP